jgi:hypothetical protein
VDGGWLSALEYSVFSGPGGVTPPGGNNGSPGDFACSSGALIGNEQSPTGYCCLWPSGLWTPDLQKTQMSWSAGVLVKF